MLDWGRVEFFEPSEFDSPDEPGSGAIHMKAIFIEKLAEARKLANVPFRINSGYRSVAHNHRVGGMPNSAHLRGLAADIRVFTAAERHAILWAAHQVGFKRIGIYKTFIHLDYDTSLPQEVVWVG